MCRRMPYRFDPIVNQQNSRALPSSRSRRNPHLCRMWTHGSRGPSAGHDSSVALLTGKRRQSRSQWTSGGESFDDLLTAWLLRYNRARLLDQLLDARKPCRQVGSINFPSHDRRTSDPPDILSSIGQRGGNAGLFDGSSPPRRLFRRVRHTWTAPTQLLGFRSPPRPQVRPSYLMPNSTFAGPPGWRAGAYTRSARAKQSLPLTVDR